MDQRYYAVTSAAQLFCDTLDGQEFTVRRYYEYKEINDVKWVYSEATDSVIKLGEPTTIPTVPSYTLYMQIPGDTISYETERSANPRSASFLAEAALWYVFGDKIYDDYTASDLVAQSCVSGHFADPLKLPKSWMLEIDAGSAYPDLKVIAAVAMAPDGSMTITFSNAADTAEEDVFSVEVKLAASADTQTYSTGPSRSSKIIEISEDSYTERQTDVSTETKTTTIKWTVTDIKKVTA